MYRIKYKYLISNSFFFDGVFYKLPSILLIIVDFSYIYNLLYLLFGSDKLYAINKALFSDTIWRPLFSALSYILIRFNGVDRKIFEHSQVDLLFLNWPIIHFNFFFSILILYIYSA